MREVTVRAGIPDVLARLLAESRLVTRGPVAIGIGVAVGSVLPVVFEILTPRLVLLILLGGVVVGVAVVRPSLAVTLVVGAFVFSGLIRRLLPAADPSADPASVIPFLIAAPLAFRGLRARKRVCVSVFAGWTTLVLMLSLFLGSLGRGDPPAVAVAGWINVAIPLLAAVGIAAAPDQLRQLSRSVVVLSAVGASYGIAQYFIPFSWDLRWLVEAGFVSAGQFGRPSFRPFGTFASPGTAAVVCAIALLLLVVRRSDLEFPPLVRAWALLSLATFLALVQVRAAWIAFAAAALVGVLAAKGRPMRQMVAPVAVVVCFIALTPQGQLIADRFRSLADVTDDVSYQNRVNLLARAGDLTTPFGSGLGHLSAGSRAEGGGVGIDNGYIVVLGEMGVVGLGLLGWILVSAARGARTEELPFVALLVVINLAGFLFANVGGLLLWIYSGAVAPEDPLPTEGGDALSLP